MTSALNPADGQLPRPHAGDRIRCCSWRQTGLDGRVVPPAPADPEDINVTIIAIEEHWNSAAIRDALDRLPGGARDESVAFNTMGDNQARLEDIGQGRVEAMNAAGIDVSILSVVTPATQALPAREAIALARDANDQATSAVRAHPARLRAFATLPTSDPQAAAAELERCATPIFSWCSVTGARDPIPPDLTAPTPNSAGRSGRKPNPDHCRRPLSRHAEHSDPRPTRVAP
jgi:Amidohydrolase